MRISEQVKEIRDMAGILYDEKRYAAQKVMCQAADTIDSLSAKLAEKDRFALITVLGNKYVLVDIFLRMLKPEELKLGQGFPKDYIIDRDYNGNKYPVSKQVARIGNSIVPIMAQKLVETNCSYLKVGERQPIVQIENITVEKDGQLQFA